jgi:hypothetical protein
LTEGQLRASGIARRRTEEERTEAFFPLRATTTAAGSSRDARAAAQNRNVPYESWVDRQIREAIERGEFDNLPGRGKPIKGLNGRDVDNWWVKAYLEREQLPLPLPTALALRKEVKALPETLADITDETSVREIVTDLNRRIAESHRRRLDGPPIVIGLVNVERAVAEWRRRRA